MSRPGAGPQRFHADAGDTHLQLARLSPRHRLFNVFCIAFPAEESIKRIYCTILEAFFTGGAFDKVLGGDFAEKLSSVAMDAFTAIVEALPPTPAKFHYIFNLRDLSRITEGVMLCTPDKFPTSASVARLLRHEICRVFCDRLVSTTDRGWFATKMATVLKEKVAKEWAEDDFRSLLFGSYMNASKGAAVAPYEACEMKASQAKFADYLGDYNLATTKPMNLVFFSDACAHLARISRVERGFGSS